MSCAILGAPMRFLPILAIALFLVTVLWLSARANELFCVSARDGRLLVIRGRIPPSLLTAFADILRRARVPRATIRAWKSEGHARIEASGVDEGTAQMLRNAFGLHPIQRLKTAPLVAHRNLGQILGVAWLAWLSWAPRAGAIKVSFLQEVLHGSTYIAYAYGRVRAFCERCMLIAGLSDRLG